MSIIETNLNLNGIPIRLAYCYYNTYYYDIICNITITIMFCSFVIDLVLVCVIGLV